MKSFVRKAPVMDEIDGREFVDVKDFLACYPDANTHAAELFTQMFDGRCDIEKIDYDILYTSMVEKCLKSRHVIYSPLVLKDGWVFWLDGRHEKTIAVLGSILSTQSYVPSDYSVLKKGQGWYVSTMEPRLIQCCESYMPIKDERVIFSTFESWYLRM